MVNSRRRHGPPVRRGRYAQDGAWWWDDLQQSWSRVAEGRDDLEIELEDVGGTSWWASLLTTLSSQYGTATMRFVGRARSADPRWPTYVVPGATFQTPRVVKDAVPQEAWAPGMTRCLDDLRAELVAQGWRRTGTGPLPWQDAYVRPWLEAPSSRDAAPDEPSQDHPGRSRRVLER